MSDGWFWWNIKREVFGLVKSNKITINSAEEFAREASRAVPLIKPIYDSQDDEIIEPSFVRTAPKIDGTLDVHHVKRSFNADGVCFLEFRRLSNDPETFRGQYYPSSNMLICDRNQSLEASDNECGNVKLIMKKTKHGFSVPRITSGFTIIVSKNRFSYHVDDFSMGRNFQVAASFICFLILRNKSLPNF